MVTSSEIRERFLEFFRARGHAIVPSVSLVPEGDTTTLFTGSGMQPLVKYLLGEPHPLGKRIVNSQRCFRAEDIEEVGDNRHTTFFEMLGNWSFGDYFKEEQLPWFFEFLTELPPAGVGLNPSKLYVTVFAGDKTNGIPRDEESVHIWKRLFREKNIDAKDIELFTVERGGTEGMRGGRIFYYDATKNWWSRTGAPATMPARELGGPDSEVFYEFTQVAHDPKYGAHCHPNCDCGRFLEIGNSVFMEYRKTEAGTFEALPQRNVDFGAGLERITAAANDDPDIFHIDIFRAMQDALGTSDHGEPAKAMKQRVILDHLRASVFLLADGVVPSNKGQGYMLRRLIRRAMVHARLLGLGGGWMERLVGSVAHSYRNTYPFLVTQHEKIAEAIRAEESRFNRLIEEGLKVFGKLESVSGTAAFDLHQSYGFPFELTRELAAERGIEVSKTEFEEAFRKHQEISRAGQERKFGGHGLLLDTGELKARDEAEVKIVTRLHTATHMLQAALREVLGSEVKQTGSDITAERTRFDFTFPRKLIPEEIKKVEELVNQKIKEDLPVAFVELPIEEARQTGALFFFKAKYGERVKVYYIGRSLEAAWSKEFCGGPHVAHTGEVGKFRIAKEEAVAAGVRRIRGVVE